MTHPYPQDADGDSLRRIESHGSDMSKPMAIDFFVAVPDEEAGENIRILTEKAGFDVKLVQDDETKNWTCYCTRIMVPAHNEIVAIQADLATMSKPFGGYDDGWGTFGNGD